MSDVSRRAVLGSSLALAFKRDNPYATVLALDNLKQRGPLDPALTKTLGLLERGLMGLFLRRRCGGGFFCSGQRCLASRHGGHGGDHPGGDTALKKDMVLVVHLDCSLEVKPSRLADRLTRPQSPITSWDAPSLCRTRPLCMSRASSTNHFTARG